MKFLMFLFSILLSLTANAQADKCSTEMEKIVKFAYNDGGMEITKLLGPYSYTQPFFDQHGNSGLKFFRTYTVAYKWGQEFAKPAGSVLITAECGADSEPVYLIDTNKDGLVDLSDMVSVYSTSH